MLRLSRINWRIALPVLGVLFIGLASFFAVRAWQERRSRDPLAGVGPGVYQPPPKPAGDVLPLPPAAPPKK
jgi:hypothetical protein